MLRSGADHIGLYPPPPTPPRPAIGFQLYKQNRDLELFMNLSCGKCEISQKYLNNSSIWGKQKSNFFWLVLTGERIGNSESGPPKQDEEIFGIKS
jgi:hypothetical protein